MTKSNVRLDTMLAEDVGQTEDLIATAMNPDEGRWAGVTMRRHFDLQRLGVSDGRQYFVTRDFGRVIGIVGLHHYEWGPSENVWLGWFAVAPQEQGKGLGRILLLEIQGVAYAQGFRKLFIETYGSKTFEMARVFYANQGFQEAGRIANYLPDSSDMIVFSKIISKNETANS
jgi:GNAT superfamily N-acetyltransferase